MGFKKSLVLIGTSTALFMGGCSPVAETEGAVNNFLKNHLSKVVIPYKWFKLDESQQKKAENKWNTYESISFNQDNSGKKIDNYLNVVSNIEKELVDKKDEMPYSHSSSWEVFHFYHAKAVNNDTDVLKDVITDIYQTDYQTIDSLTLVGIGYKNGSTVLKATLNAVNDTMKFHITPLYFYLDDSGQQVLKVEEAGLAYDNEYTPMPLSKDSEWYKDSHKNFKLNYDMLIDFPQSKDWKNVSQDVFDTFLTENEVEHPYKSAKSFLDWYKTSEGKFSRAAITGY